MRKFTFLAALLALSLASCRQTSEKASSSQNTTWELTNYVDDFGEPTEDTYVQTNCEGYLQNDVTDNGSLEATLLIDKHNVRILVLEYGKFKVTSYRDFYERKVSIRVRSGNKKDVNLGDTDAATFSDGYFVLSSSAKKKLMPILYAGGKVSFRIGFEGTAYYFTIPDTSGLKEVLQKTKMQEVEVKDSVA